MELFDLDQKKIQPKAHTLLIKEFKKIWDRNKDKEFSIKELLFVYYLADYKTVYLSTPPEDRERIIIEDLALKNWTPDTDIKNACLKYEHLQKTTSMRFLKSQMNALEEMITYFNNVDFTERDRKGQPVYKITEITNAMGNSAKLISAIEQLELKVRREISVQDQTRGGSEKSFFEDPADMEKVQGAHVYKD